MYKQCLIQLVKSGAFSVIWLAVKEAVQDSIVNVDYKAFNINGEAKILEVYNSFFVMFVLLSTQSIITSLQ